jgi:hypothetical protein
MKRISPTLHGFGRCLLLAGLMGSALSACSDEATPENGGGAGTSPGGSSSAGTATSGGSAPQAGTATSAGTATGGSSAGTATTGGSGGSGGSAAGSSSGGSGGSGGAVGGSGGKAGGGGGGAGGGGGGASGMPTAVATIMGINGMTVTGTATFTQGATTTKLVLNLTACPNGAHSSHLHLVKDCGNNGTAAMGHWTPNGEMLGDYSCVDNKVTHEVSKPIGTWTVGDGGATDVTKYSFMVHEMSDAQASGARIGCGLVNKQ